MTTVGTWRKEFERALTTFESFFLGNSEIITLDRREIGIEMPIAMVEVISDPRMLGSTPGGL